MQILQSSTWKKLDGNFLKKFQIHEPGDSISLRKNCEMKHLDYNKCSCTEMERRIVKWEWLD